MSKPTLNEDEENFVKDILKTIGNDSRLTTKFSAAMGIKVADFDVMADSVFYKMGNGRVTIEQ